MTIERDRAASGITLVIIAHLALLTTGLVGDLMLIVVRYQIEHAGHAFSATRWIQPLSLTLSLLNLVLFALFPLGLLRYHAALRDSGRWLTRLAVAAGFATLLFQLVRDGVHQLTGLSVFELPPIWVLRGSSLVWQLAELATYALLLTVVVQGTSRLGHRTPRALLVALAISALYCFVYPLLMAVGLPALVEGPILGVAVYATVRSGFSVALILLLLRHRRHLRQLPAPQSGESTPILDDPGWDLAARGLSTYGGGVLLQIALGLLGILFTLAAGRSGNLEQIKGALVVAGVLGLLAAPVVLAGIARYGRVPWESGARPAATAGLLLMLVTLALNLLSLVLVIRATRSSRMWALYDLVQKDLPVVEGAIYLVGLAGILALLRSFAALATHLELSPLRLRIASLSWAVPILAVFAATARFFGKQIPVALLLPLAVLTLIGAVVLLVQYLQLVFALAREIRGRTAEAARAVAATLISGSLEP